MICSSCDKAITLWLWLAYILLLSYGRTLHFRGSVLELWESHCLSLSHSCAASLSLPDHLRIPSVRCFDCSSMTCSLMSVKMSYILAFHWGVASSSLSLHQPRRTPTYSWCIATICSFSGGVNVPLISTFICSYTVPVRSSSLRSGRWSV